MQAANNRPEPMVTAQLTAARVSRVDGDDLLLDEPGLSYPAGRAASCLTAPRPGDEVLVAHLSDGRALVTAVLKREEGDDAVHRLELSGDVELRASSGRLDLTAKDGVSLTTPGRVELSGSSFGLRAAVGQVAVDNLTVAGKVARAAYDRARLAVKSVDSTVDRALYRFKTRFCRVDDLDQQRAGMLQQKVDNVHAVESGYTVMRSKNEVRIDGKQVIVG